MDKPNKLILDVCMGHWNPSKNFRWFLFCHLAFLPQFSACTFSVLQASNGDKRPWSKNGGSHIKAICLITRSLCHPSLKSKQPVWLICSSREREREREREIDPHAQKAPSLRFISSFDLLARCTNCLIWRHNRGIWNCSGEREIGMRTLIWNMGGGGFKEAFWDMQEGRTQNSNIFGP